MRSGASRRDIRVAIPGTAHRGGTGESADPGATPPPACPASDAVIGWPLPASRRCDWSASPAASRSASWQPLKFELRFAGSASATPDSEADFRPSLPRIGWFLRKLENHLAVWRGWSAGVFFLPFQRGRSQSKKRRVSGVQVSR